MSVARTERGAHEGAAITWRQHPRTGLWHACTRGAAWSVCRYTNAVGGTESAEMPTDRVCRFCCYALNVPRPTAPRPPEPEEMCIEFTGGRYDGVKLRDLRVVPHDATHFTVVGQGRYAVKSTVTMASEVEHPAKGST